LQDGDIINIDIPQFKLEVKLDEKEISNRLSKLSEFESKIKKGYLKYYIKNVSSASTGAVFG